MVTRTFTRLLIAIQLAGVAQGIERADVPNEVKPSTDEGTLKVYYHRFVLLKHDGNLIALHLLPNPAHGHDGIGYRWYHLTDGTSRFFRPSPDRADASPNPDLKTGAGETHEVDRENGVIKAGTLDIPWSKGNHRCGWLYLFKATNEIEVYPVQFERLEDCSGKLEVKRWIKLKKKDS
jgi:hypothetical protein